MQGDTNIYFKQFTFLKKKDFVKIIHIIFLKIYLFLNLVLLRLNNHTRPPFYVIFCCLIRSKVKYLLNGPNKDTYCYGWYSLWCRKYKNILQFNTILTNLFLVTAVAQFTAKMSNSERAIYFLWLKSCSVNKLKSDMLFTCKNVMFSYFTWKKIFTPGNDGGGRGVGWCPTAPPFFYGPDRLSVLKRN